MISRVGEDGLSEETFLSLRTGQSLWGVASHHCYSWLPSDYIPKEIYQLLSGCQHISARQNKTKEPALPQG